MANQWTSQYPTQPGYYWLRNYTVQRYNHQVVIPGCVIVDLDDDLRIHLEGEDPLYFGKDIISAEWCGPILPPQDNDAEWLQHKPTKHAPITNWDKVPPELDGLVPVMPHRWHIEPHDKCWCLAERE